MLFGTARNNSPVASDGIRLAQITRECFQAAVDRVYVRVLESRQHHAALQIVNLGCRTDTSAHGVVRADKRNFAIANGDCLRPGFRRIECVYLAGVIDGVGKPGALRLYVLDDFAALDDNRDILQKSHVFERIAADCHQVAIATDFDGTDIGGHLHVLCGKRCCALDGIHWRHAAAHHDPELPAVHAVLQNTCIGSIKNRHPSRISFLKNNTLCFGGFIVLAHELFRIAELLADFRSERAVVDIHGECDTTFCGQCHRLVITE